MKKCINCHFLIHETISIETNLAEKYSLSNESRQELRTDINNFRKNGPTKYLCNFDIWNPEMITDLEILRKEIFDKNRKSCINFLNHQKGVGVEALNSIKKFRDDKQDAKINRIIALTSLFFSIPASVVAIIAFIKVFSK